MDLFYSAASPYARKIRILMREFGVSVNEVLTDTKENDPAFIASNPLGKVPSLVLDSGEMLFDSQVIASYLDDTFNESKWSPASLSQKTLLAATQGVLDEAVTMILEKRRPESLRFDYWIERYRLAIPRTVAWIWQQHQPALQEMSLASITFACGLDYCDFRHEDVDWDRELPEARAWLKEFTNRPSFTETSPH
ncbi:MAG: glutathione S-transferase N-terminal domain-containing protein [Pseudobacteriovorax sp.]|nr:glutathione S-transferase N-terminal domain-containing protein [Pseudobacteriovorax sp.]